MKTKLKYLIVLCFLFLFSGSVYGGDFQDATDAYNRQDYKEAVRLYRLSAEQGNALAQYNLGMVYKNGEGVPQDDTLAHMWWNIAGSKGHEEATDKRVLLEKIMTESQIKKANELARKRKSKM